MKKIIALMLLGFTQIGTSQPILNSTDFPASYTAVGFAAEFQNFSAGPSGENVVWDYSNVTFTNVPMAYSIVPASTVTSSNFYPQANFCEKYEYNGYPSYRLYTLSNETLELVAIYNPDAGTANYSYDPGTIYNFPYIYSNEFTDTIWSFGSPAPPEPFSRKYDAYGTLITPYGTFSNVIRQKLINAFDQVTYTWISTSPYRVLLEAQYADNPGSQLNVNTPQSVYFYIDSTLAVNLPEITSEIKIFPNPTDDAFSFVTPQQGKLLVKVYDGLGKQLLQNDNYTSGSFISLKEYASGIYIVKLLDEKQKTVFSKKLIKN